MPKAEPQAGEVWTYDYLWQRDQAKGQTSGEKTRPTCIALRPTKPAYADFVVFLGITTSEPLPHQTAVLIPDSEHENAGLVALSWVILNECNYENVADVLELDFVSKRGSFSPVFWQSLQREILKAVNVGLMKKVPRD